MKDERMKIRAQLIAQREIVTMLPIDDQIKIANMKEAIRKIVTDGGDYGFMALSIIGPEIALEKEAELNV